MNELEIAKNALEQIVGYYRRSHKHGKNTCYAMCLEAERALREMSLEADYSKADPISRTWDTPEEDEAWRSGLRPPLGAT